MQENILSTYFAPAERNKDSQVKTKAKNLLKHALIQELTNLVSEIFIILNDKRQIVFANPAALEAFGPDSPNKLYGMRPGEAFGCVNSKKLKGGCGTNESCTQCGVTNSILISLNGDSSVMECRILQENGKALDLRLRCAPITIDGEIFSIFVAHNIENEKRREALERIFFHDIINTASGLKGLINFMEENSNKEEFKTYKNMMEISIDTLIEEISAQQDLLAAENKKLKLHLERFDSFSIMEEVTAIYKRHEAGMGKKLKISNNSCREKISSDKRLLKRTISNMTKNALEASKLDETVTLGCMSWEDSIEFWTHNKRCIPREVQLQIFQRSFSTKGRGRGIGTWSIKLLTEQYLQGSVSFESSEESGTVFKVIIPFEDSRKSEE